MNRSIVLLVVAVLFAPAFAEASAQGTQVIKNWKSSDKCAQQAQTAFPDLTPESNAKRDAQLKACLEGQRLAPRAPSGPSQ